MRMEYRLKHQRRIVGQNSRFGSVVLITGEIDGTRSCYCSNVETMRVLRERFGQLFGSFENCC